MAAKREAVRASLRICPDGHGRAREGDRSASASSGLLEVLVSGSLQMEDGRLW